MTNITRYRWPLVVLGLSIVAIGWWLGSPLFLDKTVEEDFPLARTALVPTGMSAAEVEAEMAEAREPDGEMDEPMTAPMQTAGAIKTGAFRDADSFHKGSGRATIYRLEDGSQVLRLEDFRVTNGPDLRVLLAVHPDPASRDELTSRGYVELAKLKGNVGNQNYEIPESVDVSAQMSVVIYCRPFHVIFSVAPLEEPEN